MSNAYAGWFIAGGQDFGRTLWLGVAAAAFFIMAGSLMNSGGITTRIYDFALALVGWMKGGLGHVNVVGSVIFAGRLKRLTSSRAPAGPTYAPAR